MAFNINTMREILGLVSNEKFDLTEVNNIIQKANEKPMAPPPPPPSVGAAPPPPPPPPGAPPAPNLMGVKGKKPTGIEGIELVLEINDKLKKSSLSTEQQNELMAKIVSGYLDHILLKDTRLQEVSSNPNEEEQRKLAKEIEVKNEIPKIILNIIDLINRNNTDKSILVNMVKNINSVKGKKEDPFGSIRNITNNYFRDEKIKQIDFISEEVSNIINLKKDFLDITRKQIELSPEKLKRAKEIIAKRDQILHDEKTIKALRDKYQGMVNLLKSDESLRGEIDYEKQIIEAIKKIAVKKKLNLSKDILTQLARSSDEDVEKIMKGLGILDSKANAISRTIMDSKYFETKKREEIKKNKKEKTIANIKDELTLLAQAWFLYTQKGEGGKDLFINDAIKICKMISRREVDLDYNQVKNAMDDFFLNKSNYEVMQKIHDFIKYDGGVGKKDDEEIENLKQSIIVPESELNVFEIILNGALKEVVHKYEMTSDSFKKRTLEYLEQESNIQNLYGRLFSVHGTGEKGAGIQAGKLMLDNFLGGAKRPIENKKDKEIVKKKEKPYLTGLVVNIGPGKYYVVSNEHAKMLEDLTNGPNAQPIYFDLNSNMQGGNDDKPVRIVTEDELKDIISPSAVDSGDNAYVITYAPYLGFLTKEQKDNLIDFLGDPTIFSEDIESNEGIEKLEEIYTSLMRKSKTMGDILQVALGYHYRPSTINAMQISEWEKEGYYFKYASMLDDFFEKDAVLYQGGDSFNKKAAKTMVVGDAVKTASKDSGQVVANDMIDFMEESLEKRRKLIDLRAVEADKKMEALLKLVGGDVKNLEYKNFHESFNNLFEKVKETPLPLDPLFTLLMNNPNPEDAKQFADAYATAALIQAAVKKTLSEIDTQLDKVDKHVEKLIQQQADAESKAEDDVEKANKLEEIRQRIMKEFPGIEDQKLIDKLVEAQYQLEAAGKGVAQLSEQGVIDSGSKQEMDNLQKKVVELSQTIETLRRELKDKGQGYDEQAELKEAEAERAQWEANKAAELRARAAELTRHEAAQKAVAEELRQRQEAEAVQVAELRARAEELARHEAAQAAELQARAEELARNEAAQKALAEELRRQQAELDAQRQAAAVPQVPPQTLVGYFQNSGFNVKATLEYARNVLELDNINPRELKGSLGRIFRGNRAAMLGNIQASVNDYNSNNGNNYRDAELRRNRP